MQVAEVKTSSSASPTIKAKRQPFFNNEGKEGFFSKSTEATEAFFNPTTVQPKLTIGQPNDKYEVEADAMADKVVQRLSATDVQSKKETTVQAKPLATSITPVVQKKCTSCEKEEQHLKQEDENLVQESPLELQLKPIFESNAPPPPDDDQTIQRKCAACEKEGEKKLQAKPNHTGPTTSAPSLESTLTSSKGGGSPLPENTRLQMEDSFGTDFSGVRVHTDSSAVQMNKDLSAQAFAHGSDIYFNQGKYDPNSSSGKHLLAHELTHTVQQKGASGVSKKIQRWPDWVSDTAGWVGDTVSDVAGSVVDGAEFVGGRVADGARWVGGKVVSGAQWVGDQISAGAQWVIDQIRSVINSGSTYLNEKWQDIKDFGSSCFDDIKNGFGNLIHFVTTPLSSLMSALSEMNADLLGGIWNLVKSGSNALWTGINAVINGVLQIGQGIWTTVSGFIDGIFNTIDGLFDNTLFNLLPGWIKDELRSLLNGLRSLWNNISSFWTDLWQRLEQNIQEIVASVREFVDNVIDYSIGRVIKMVRDLKELYDYVTKLFADPEATIQPFIDKIAGKLNAEVPPKANDLGTQLAQQNYTGETTEAVDNGSIQKQSSGGEERTTASLYEVIKGVIFYVIKAWTGLDIKKMLWDTIVNMFWPPATIRAIFRQFSQLWNDDWATTVNSLYTPRNFFDSPIGCLHDVWSNFLILLDFPLALWRTLNNVVGLLMGYISIIIILVEAVLGGIAAVEVGVVPGIIAGAAAGLATVGVIGEALMASFIAAEGITAEVVLLRLFTARQTCQKRQVDILTSVASFIAMAVALALEMLMAILAELVTLVANLLKGASRGVPVPAPGVPAPAPGLPAPAPAPGIPAPAPGVPVPAPRVPAPGRVPQPSAPGGGNVVPFPSRPTLPAPQPTPAVPGGGNVIPLFPNSPTPVPQPVPVAPLPPGQIAAKFEEGENHVSSRNNFNEENKSLGTKNKQEDNKKSNNAIETTPLSSVAHTVNGTIQTARKDQIDPDACKKEDDSLYKWEPKIKYKHNPTRPGKFNYGGKTRPGVNYSPQAHHSWPKVLGGDPNQRLVTIIETIHQSEIHRGFSPVGSPVIAVIGSIYAFLTKYINSSATFGPGGSNVLQGRPLNHTGSSGSSNQLLIDAMKRGTSTSTRLKGTVRQGMTNYYEAFEAASNPIMPKHQYKDGLDDSYNYI